MTTSVNGLDVPDSLALSSAEEAFISDMTSVTASLAQTRVTCHSSAHYVARSVIPG